MKQELKLRLITQGDVTILEGEVPVVTPDGGGDDLSSLGQIVNFLRSGCPAVQVTTSYPEDVGQSIHKLELPGEIFSCEIQEGIALITRTKK
ncbi:MAG TPA: hypothetical protein VI953_01900 [Candidatus Paceibacterota bacterium]